MNLSASYLRRLAAETEYRHHATKGYVCADRLKILLDALRSTADAQDRREVFRLRCLMGATVLLSGIGVAALVLTSYLP